MIIAKYVSLLVVLCISAYYDLLYGRIPNKVIAFGGFCALCLLAAEYGVAAGTMKWLLRIMAALIIFIPIHALKLIGAGDVKLLFVLSAYISFGYMIISFAIGIYIALIPLTTSFLRHGSVKSLKLPMAPCILSGSILCLILLRKGVVQV